VARLGVGITEFKKRLAEPTRYGSAGSLDRATIQKLQAFAASSGKAKFSDIKNLKEKLPFDAFAGQSYRILGYHSGDRSVRRIMRPTPSNPNADLVGREVTPERASAQLRNEARDVLRQLGYKTTPDESLPAKKAITPRAAESIGASGRVIGYDASGRPIVGSPMSRSRAEMYKRNIESGTIRSPEGTTRRIELAARAGSSAPFKIDRQKTTASQARIAAEMKKAIPSAAKQRTKQRDFERLLLTPTPAGKSAVVNVSDRTLSFVPRRTGPKPSRVKVDARTGKVSQLPGSDLVTVSTASYRPASAPLSSSGPTDTGLITIPGARERAQVITIPAVRGVVKDTLPTEIKMDTPQFESRIKSLERKVQGYNRRREALNAEMEAANDPNNVKYAAMSTGAQLKAREKLIERDVKLDLEKAQLDKERAQLSRVNPFGDRGRAALETAGLSGLAFGGFGGAYEASMTYARAYDTARAAGGGISAGKLAGETALKSGKGLFNVGAGALKAAGLGIVAGGAGGYLGEMMAEEATSKALQITAGTGKKKVTIPEWRFRLDRGLYLQDKDYTPIEVGQRVKEVTEIGTIAAVSVLPGIGQAIFTATGGPRVLGRLTGKPYKAPVESVRLITTEAKLGDNLAKGRTTGFVEKGTAKGKSFVEEYDLAFQKGVTGTEASKLAAKVDFQRTYGLDYGPQSDFIAPVKGKTGTITGQYTPKGGDPLDFTAAAKQRGVKPSTGEKDIIGRTLTRKATGGRRPRLPGPEDPVPKIETRLLTPDGVIEVPAPKPRARGGARVSPVKETSVVARSRAGGKSLELRYKADSAYGKVDVIETKTFVESAPRVRLEPVKPKYGRRGPGKASSTSLNEALKVVAETPEPPRLSRGGATVKPSEPSSARASEPGFMSWTETGTGTAQYIRGGRRTAGRSRTSTADPEEVFTGRGQRIVDKILADTSTKPSLVTGLGVRGVPVSVSGTRVSPGVRVTPFSESASLSLFQTETSPISGLRIDPIVGTTPTTSTKPISISDTVVGTKTRTITETTPVTETDLVTSTGTTIPEVSITKTPPGVGVAPFALIPGGLGGSPSFSFPKYSPFRKGRTEVGVIIKSDPIKKTLHGFSDIVASPKVAAQFLRRKSRLGALYGRPETFEEQARRLSPKKGKARLLLGSRSNVLKETSGGIKGVKF